MKHPFDIHIAFLLSQIKTDILAVMCSLDSDPTYTQEQAVSELTKIVRDIHTTELMEI